MAHAPRTDGRPDTRRPHMPVCCERETQDTSTPAARMPEAFRNYCRDINVQIMPIGCDAPHSVRILDPGRLRDSMSFAREQMAAREPVIQLVVREV